MTETVIKKRRVLTLKIKPETKVLIEEKTSALEEKMLLEEKISTAEEKISTKDTTDEAKTVAELKKLPKKKKKKGSTFNEILRLVQEKLPKAFPKEKCLLLKIGIDVDIAKELKLSRWKVKKFLSIYTCSEAYVKEHVVDSPRYDLNGEVVGKVSEKQVEKKSETPINLKLRLPSLTKA